MLENLLTPLLSNFDSLRSPQPEDTLYHYTSLEGLKGIIENRELWFTNAAFLNDEQEIQFGSSILTGLVAGRQKPEKHAHVAHLLDSLDYASIFHGAGQVFTFSLSRALDDLGQWRGYSPGAGVALGMSSEIHLIDSSPVFCLATCYSEQEQLRIVEFALDRLLADFEAKWDFDAELKANSGLLGFSTTAHNQTFLNLLYCYFEFLTIVFCILKAPIYEREQEIRLFTLRATRSHSSISFRSKGSMLVPYTVVKCADLKHIREVRIAPWEKDPMTKTSLDYFLEHFGLKPARLSELKLRR